MIATLFGIIFALVIYYLLWKLWLFAAPKFSSETTPVYIVRPKFWQFAIALFIAVVVLKKL